MMKLSRWVEQLQSAGRYTFTRSEVETQTGRSAVAAQSALRRLRRQGRIASPKRGFHVVVPPEYRAAGSPPASWFIDDLMRFLGQPYYVSLLSAAAYYGAAHQQPMTFQVVTTRPTRPIRSGRVSIRFWMASHAELMPTSQAQTETGTMRLATPETAAFDLVRYPAAAGSLSSVATVLSELAERLDPESLVLVAPLVRLPDVQRLGYLLEVVGARQKTVGLATWIDAHSPRPAPLRPGADRAADSHSRWRVIPNEELELDL
jgi:predicted transcriptional regulator of viral defense system